MLSPSKIYLTVFLGPARLRTPCMCVPEHATLFKRYRLTFIPHKIHSVHLHVGANVEEEVYEATGDPFYEQQLPTDAPEIFEDLDQRPEEPKAAGEGKQHA